MRRAGRPGHCDAVPNAVAVIAGRSGRDAHGPVPQAVTPLPIASGMATAALTAARLARYGAAATPAAGGENGIESGDTAPPEMMKLIAWSTVQSVGVIFSTGTISR